MVQIIVIGITGKTASGKSTLSSYLHEIIEDSAVADADGIAGNIYNQNPEVLKELRSRFEKDIFFDKLKFNPKETVFIFDDPVRGQLDLGVFGT